MVAPKTYHRSYPFRVVLLHLLVFSLSMCIVPFSCPVKSTFLTILPVNDKRKKESVLGYFMLIVVFHNILVSSLPSSVLISLSLIYINFLAFLQCTSKCFSLHLILLNSNIRFCIDFDAFL